MEISVKDLRVRYELSGKEGAGVVVLSHSLGSSLVMWEPQMEILQSRFRVLRYDTRGHGGTAAPSGPYRLGELTEDAIGLLDALGLGKVSWVGLSMGGMIGQALALDHPERLERLVLCDTAAVIPKESQPIWEERILKARTEGLESLVQETLERWFTAPFLKRNPQGAGMIREQFLKTPVAGYVGCSGAIRKLDLLHRLPEIRLPTLIMVGEEDPATPVAASEVMHQEIAGSKLVILPAAAHLSNIEQAEAFNRELLGFLP